jgi:hypothetical protein
MDGTYMAQRSVTDSEVSEANSKDRDSLDAYWAEVRAIEDEWIEQPRPDGWCLNGESAWDTPEALSRLREINQRYQIAPDDARVYSIAAYINEYNEIEKNGPKVKREDFNATMKHNARQYCCAARLFPSPHVRRVDSIPKLWRFIQSNRAVLVPHIRDSPESQNTENRVNSVLEDVLGLLIKFQVPWASSPPYSRFSAKQGDHKLIEIANRLTAEEAQAIGDDPTQPHPIASPVDKSNSAARIHTKRGEAKGNLEATIGTLIEGGLLGWQDEKIIKTARISRSTFYKLLKENEDIERLYKKYQARSKGRGPVSAREV